MIEQMQTKIVSKNHQVLQLKALLRAPNAKHKAACEEHMGQIKDMETWAEELGLEKDEKFQLQLLNVRGCFMST